ncbi:ATP-binding domain-containing protein, partial [Actinomadura roseirufa]|uniref:ATP-binding domain-containing protein n=1 Tax=Actinomadura roseirufa TaxID=2094049 RepID=UPI0013F17A6F
ARPARAVRTSGVEPRVRTVPAERLAAAAREAAEELLDRVEGTIGVIVPLALDGEAPPPARSRVTQDALWDDADDADDATPEDAAPDAGRGVSWDAGARERLGAGLPGRVQVLDVLEAKGLEFDAAVIIAPETVAAQSPRGLRVLYVAVSRATQRLTVLTADPEWERTLLSG